MQWLVYVIVIVCVLALAWVLPQLFRSADQIGGHE